LIDYSEFAWLRTGSYIVGSISRDWFDEKAPVDVLIEFTEGSIDAGIHNREAIRHYLIDGDKVRRVDPVALGPRDFVDEWLTRPWKESATWSASPALEQWHRKFHAGSVGGEFTDATRHCQTPDLWQVASGGTYFLIRWTPPFRFTMIKISNRPWPLCTQPDREADAWRTLFNTQEWRQ
jgi:hypothetical protein